MIPIPINSFIRLTAVNDEIRAPIQPGDAQLFPLFLVEKSTVPTELEGNFIHNEITIPQSGLWHFNSLAETDETAADMILTMHYNGIAVRGLSSRIAGYNRAMAAVNATLYLEAGTIVGRYLQVSGDVPVAVRQFSESNFLEITFLG